MQINTDGLIIAEQKVGERDRLVTVLTRNIGVINAFVRGTVNIKNSKNSATRLLCYSDLSIYKGRGKYIIDEAESKEMFIKLSTDIKKMSLAQYFCQLAKILAPRESQSEEVLRTVLNSLFVLAKGTKPALQIKAVLELRLISLAGYMPDLVCCKECKAFEHPSMAFIPNEGKLICGNCINKYNGLSVTVGMGVTSAMRHSIYAEPQKLFSFSLPDDSLKLFANTVETYLLKYVDKQSLPTLEFYKTIAA